MDILYLGATLVLAAVIHGLVLACDKLGGRA
jgi:hypothetical protein